MLRTSLKHLHRGKIGNQGSNGYAYVSSSIQVERVTAS